MTQYSERVIHGEIYKARPEVNSVCHHHCAAFMPLLATGTDYVPVFHLGAIGGIKPPFWDQHDEFGDTNMLVCKPEEGASLARALGPWMVLMKRHGVTVAGTSVRDCVFRSIYSARNAEYQVQALRSARHRLAFAGRNQTGRPDRRHDHRPDALLGILVDAVAKAGGSPPSRLNRACINPVRARQAHPAKARRKTRRR